MSSVRAFFVYRMFDRNGELLYVGCTNNLRRRWKEHRTERPEVVSQAISFKVHGPFTREVARQKERTAAETEHPLYGWTPAKQSVINIRSGYIRRRMRALQAEGHNWHNAYDSASAEADAAYPDVSYTAPWRPLVANS
jgi:predicted GIY-YIG superfamily endonuclease